MHARVISGGDAGFEALVYQQPDQRLRDYLSNTISVATNKLSDGGSYFINAARDIYEKYNGAAAINMAKAIVGQMDTHLNPDVIISYDETNIFNATPKMQQYIMVQPELWQLDREQACSAFDGTYFNADSDVSKVEDHVRYQEVMDGMLQFNEDGEGYIVSYTNTEMEELHTYDQFAIKNSWDSVRNLLIDGIDPSSIDAEEL